MMTPLLSFLKPSSCCSRKKKNEICPILHLSKLMLQLLLLNLVFPIPMVLLIEEKQEMNKELCLISFHLLLLSGLSCSATIARDLDTLLTSVISCMGFHRVITDPDELL